MLLLLWQRLSLVLCNGVIERPGHIPQKNYVWWWSETRGRSHFSTLTTSGAFHKWFLLTIQTQRKIHYSNSNQHQQISKNFAHDLIRLPKPCHYDDKTYSFVIWIACENSEMDFNNLSNKKERQVIWPSSDMRHRMGFIYVKLSSAGMVSIWNPHLVSICFMTLIARFMGPT